LSKEHHEVTTTHESQASALTKKPFVEPEVSGPVDVLEATNFFQAVTGTTDPPVPGA
jgi:hypothetical protein